MAFNRAKRKEKDSNFGIKVFFYVDVDVDI